MTAARLAELRAIHTACTPAAGALFTPLPVRPTLHEVQLALGELLDELERVRGNLRHAVDVGLDHARARLDEGTERLMLARALAEFDRYSEWAPADKEPLAAAHRIIAESEVVP
jgi:hypothetical protein